MDPSFFDDLAHKLADSLPGSVKALQQDVEKNFHEVLQNTFNKMNLVTREEFEVQSAVLARTRSKLEALEKKVAELEAAQKD